MSTDKLLTLDSSTERVGIGTSTPSRKLHINGTFECTDEAFFDTMDAAKLTLNPTSTSGPAIEIDTDGVGVYISRNSGTQQGRIYNSSSGDHSLTFDAYSDPENTGSNMGIQFITGGGNNRMKITYDGDVGVGTTTPSRKLEVNGTFECTDEAFLNTMRVNKIYARARYNAAYYIAMGNHGGLYDFRHFTIYDNGNPVLISSDDRLKHNEVDITNALAVVRQLSPQRYDMTFGEFKDADFSGELNEPSLHQAGFIAQEVKDIPDLTFTVHVDTDNDKHSLDYTSLFTYAVAAIKELDIIVQNLQAENIILKSKLNELLSEAGKETI